MREEGVTIRKYLSAIIFLWIALGLLKIIVQHIILKSIFIQIWKDILSILMLEVLIISSKYKHKHKLKTTKEKGNTGVLYKISYIQGKLHF